LEKKESEVARWKWSKKFMNQLGPHASQPLFFASEEIILGVLGISTFGISEGLFPCPDNFGQFRSSLDSALGG